MFNFGMVSVESAPMQERWVRVVWSGGPFGGERTHHYRHSDGTWEAHPFRVSMAPSTVDVQFETAYGHTTRLPFVVRCF